MVSKRVWRYHIAGYPAPDGRAPEDIETVLADPPQVHYGAPSGVWATDRSCYDFIATALPEEGGVTLETGCGISTVLFALWAAEHVCVVPSANEVAACRAFSSSAANRTASCSSRLVG